MTPIEKIKKALEQESDIDFDQKYSYYRDNPDEAVCDLEFWIKSCQQLMEYIDNLNKTNE